MSTTLKQSHWRYHFYVPRVWGGGDIGEMVAGKGKVMLGEGRAPELQFPGQIPQTSNRDPICPN
jgi:hypothetical protein